MAFPVHLLLARPECDQVLATAQSELQVLQYQLYVTQYSTNLSTALASSLQGRVVGLDARILGYETGLPATPEGSEKKKVQDDLRRALALRAELRSRQEDQGAPAVLRRELDRAQVQAQIDVTTELIAAVEARKAQL